MFCLRPFRICAHHRPSCGNNAGEECLSTSVHGSGCNAEGLCRNAGPFLIEIFVWTAECDGRKTPGKALEISAVGTKREE